MEISILEDSSVTCGNLQKTSVPNEWMLGEVSEEGRERRRKCFSKRVEQRYFGAAESRYLRVCTLAQNLRSSISPCYTRRKGTTYGRHRTESLGQSPCV
jgi:hypothetical protein